MQNPTVKGIIEFLQMNTSPSVALTVSSIKGVGEYVVQLRLDENHVSVREGMKGRGTDCIWLRRLH
jgi:hypothetical protein